jgi:hypothetical protein
MGSSQGVGFERGQTSTTRLERPSHRASLTVDFLLPLPDPVPDGDAERGEDQDDGQGLMVAEDQDRSSFVRLWSIRLGQARLGPGHRRDG